jgi:pyruvate,water dikinase
VQGAVNPDEFYVYKPALAAGKRALLRKTLGSKAIKMVHGDDGHGTRTIDVPATDRGRFCLDEADVETLARHAVAIEKHYGAPMDIEWGKDGNDGQLYILQARPETVQSRQGRSILRFKLKDRSKVIATGRSIGQRIGAGTARIISDVKEMSRVQPGDVLIADMTDPDWEPVMKRAAAIVTNRGGRTCHAAIIARELGIPAVVGCGSATTRLRTGDWVRVDGGQGTVEILGTKASPEA